MAPGAGGLSTGRFAAFLAVLLGFAFWPVVLGVASFCFRDFWAFGYPLAYYHKLAIWGGEIPLWNPLNNCGLPFLAQWNTLVFYPGSLIYLLLPLPWSLNLYCLAHLVLAGAGMHRLAWRWTGSNLAASVAGLAFAVNGLTFNSLMWPNNVAAFGWMPFVILTVERAWCKGGRYIAIAALVGATQMLSGAPELIALTWIAIGALALSHWVTEQAGWRPNLRIPLRLGGVIVLVVALAAIQLFPFLDLLAHSHRDAQFSDGTWSLPGTGWANFLLPVFYTFQNRSGVYFQAGQYWTSSYYLGIGVLALAVFGCRNLRDRRVAAMLGVAVAGLVLALGNFSFVYEWIRSHFAPLGFIRYPSKFIALVLLAGPVLAAFGVRNLMEDHADSSGRQWSRLIGISGLLVGMILLLVLFEWRNPFWFNSHLKTDLGRLITSGLTRTAFLGLMILCLWGLCRLCHTRIWPAILTGALLLILFGDIWTHVPNQNPTVNPEVLVPRAKVMLELEPLPQPGQSRTMVTSEAKALLATGLTSRLQNDCIVSRLAQFCNLNLLDGIPKTDGFYSLYLAESAQVQAVLDRNPARKYPGLLDFLGICQFAASGTSADWEPRSSALPWITIGQATQFADPKTNLHRIFSPDFKPAETVYLPADFEDQIGKRPRVAAEIETSTTSNHRLEATYQAPTDTILVVAQSYYHPWKAEVDGVEVPVVRGNYAYQAIPVPAGRHRVVIAYKDPWFRLGAALSLTTLIFSLATLAITRGRRFTPNPNRRHFPLSMTGHDRASNLMDQ